MSVAQAEVGKRIRQARLERRWKQKQLAEKIHVEAQTISRWERGENTPDVYKLELIAEVLEKPVSFFVSADGERSLDTDLADELTTRHAELIARFDSLDEQLRVLAATAAEIQRRV